jgi:ATP-dependent DNA ligase
MHVKQKKFMLAPNDAVTPESLKDIEYPYLASFKYDGFRAVCAGGDLVSRKWRDYGVHVKVRFHPVITACRTRRYVFDGELYSEKREFHELQSMLSKTVNGDKLPADVKYYVFDGMTALEWNEGCLRTFEERLKFVREKVEAENLDDRVVIVEQVLVNNHEEALEYYQQALDNGHEGLILRKAKSLYKHNRATFNEGTMYKMKPENTVDCKLIGYVPMKRMKEEFASDENRERELTGELKRTYKQEHLEEVDEIGSYIIELPDGTTCKATIEKGVDLGIDISNIRESLGKAVEVVYMDHGVKDKPRFPRIRRWREDLD